MEIFPGIFLGDRFIARDADFIKNNKISKIVNVTTCIRNYFTDQSLETFQLQVEADPVYVDDEEEDYFDDDEIVPEDQPLPVNTEVKMDSPGSPVTSNGTTETPSPIAPPNDEIEEDDEPDYFDLPQNYPKDIDNIDEDAIPVNPGDLSVKYHRIPVADSMEENIQKHFSTAFKFISESDGATLIHCRQARSRSVAVIVAYGMHCLKKTLKESYEHIATLTHNNIRINDGFKRQLMEYEKDLFQIGENTLNFLNQRKRFVNYNEGEEKRLTRKEMIAKRKREGDYTVLLKPKLGKLDANQLTLFQTMKIQKEVKKEIKEMQKRKKKKKETGTQLSIMSFFKKK
jgi:protein-tyrosine phosphatase